MSICFGCPSTGKTKTHTARDSLLMSPSSTGRVEQQGSKAGTRRPGQATSGQTESDYDPGSLLSALSRAGRSSSPGRPVHSVHGPPSVLLLLLLKSPAAETARTESCCTAHTRAHDDAYCTYQTAGGRRVARHRGRDAPMRDETSVQAG